MNAASIKKVIFNPPATVVFWSDGTKTVVKCHVKDNFDPEKGLAMAIAKRCASNSPDFYQEIRKWIDKSGYKPTAQVKMKQQCDIVAKLVDGLAAAIMFDEFSKLFNN